MERPNLEEFNHEASREIVHQALKESGINFVAYLPDDQIHEEIDYQQSELHHGRRNERVGSRFCMRRRLAGWCQASCRFFFGSIQWRYCCRAKCCATEEECNHAPYFDGGSPGYRSRFANGLSRRGWSFAGYFRSNIRMKGFNSKEQAEAYTFFQSSSIQDLTS